MRNKQMHISLTFDDVKLPQPFKNNWIEALKSGDYKQHDYSKLYDLYNNSFSPVGIACIVCGVDRIDISNGFILPQYLNPEYNAESIMPKEMFLTKNDSIKFKHQFDVLNKHYSFEDIAEFIDKKY